MNRVLNKIRPALRKKIVHPVFGLETWFGWHDYFFSCSVKIRILLSRLSWKKEL